MRILGKSLLVLTALTVAAVPAVPGLAAPDHRPDRDLDFRQTVVDADQSFRGLDAVDRRTAWVTGGSISGGDGSVWRTTDGGRTWQDVSPPGTTGLSLRDVEARDADTAVVLSIGNGEDSRIWRTDDGGATWTETFRNDEPAAFYNCLDFFPGGQRGLAVSDPVDGAFRIIATDDGGRSWEVLPGAGMPAAEEGEANFSASGECLTIAGQQAWFGTGGGEHARVFHSGDRGRTWTATDSTIASGPAAGVFGLAFRTPREGIAVGGDFDPEATTPDGTAYSRDGRRWTRGGDLEHLGEDAAWVSRRLLVTTGESGPEAGTSVSTDRGRSWERVSDIGFHTLDCTRDGSCWAAGGGGRVARAAR